MIDSQKANTQNFFPFCECDNYTQSCQPIYNPNGGVGSWTV